MMPCSDPPHKSPYPRLPETPCYLRPGPTLGTLTECRSPAPFPALQNPFVWKGCLRSLWGQVASVTKAGGHCP